MKPISPFGLPIGISMAFWSIVSLLRFFTELFYSPFRPTKIKKPYRKKDIAAILPAHNEEKVIESSLHALLLHLKPKQVYVASDGSTDKTADIALQMGVQVANLSPARGKARAMTYLIDHFRLYEKYKLIFILDSDTRVDKEYFSRALLMFRDPDISVVFPRADITWKQHIIPRLKYYFIGYRERLDKLLWMVLVYGQTWKHTNLLPVIPGFCTLYRTSVLKQLEIDTPGILIEDFNLAFQLHKKKLGKIGHAPGLVAWDQHPDNLRDYWRQVKRWNIGFFQTVRKRGVWPSFFWLSTAIFSFEIVLNVLFTLTFPLYILYLIYPTESFIPEFLTRIAIFGQNIGLFEQYPGLLLIFNVFIIDYLYSVFIGIAYNRPQLIFYGLFFFPMHYITSLIYVSAILPGFFTNSHGRWKSPRRQQIELSY